MLLFIALKTTFILILIIIRALKMQENQGLQGLNERKNGVNQRWERSQSAQDRSELTHK